MMMAFARNVAGTALAVSVALAAGCGGGGGGSSGGGSDTVPVGGNQVTGPTDPVQEVLLDVGDQAAGAPVVGDTSAALVSALVALLDVPDGLAAGFQDFLVSQDPNDLLQSGELAGDALLSFAAGISETLIQLTEEGQAIPGSEALLPLLLQLQQAVQDGITNTTGGGDLTVVTDLLIDIAGQLTALSGQVPPQVQDAPLVGDLLAALGGASGDLATLLDAVGRLNGDDTSAALVGLLDGVADALSGSLPGDAGAMLPAALTDATLLFQNGLAVLLNPLFQALRGVLAPVTGDASPFAPVVSGLLAGDTSGLTDVGGLAALLAGGGMSSGGTQIPLLSDLLAGLPLLGDLLAGLTGGGALDGGLDSILVLLNQGGTGSVPLLGDLLQGIPGLSEPGSSAPISPAALTDLVTALFSLNGDGLPILGDVLAGAGGLGSLDATLLGTILDGLLGNLVSMFGAGAGGGFLDGSEGLLSLGSIVSGLLDSLLGGLSLG